MPWKLVKILRIFFYFYKFFKFEHFLFHFVDMLAFIFKIHKSWEVGDHQALSNFSETNFPVKISVQIFQLKKKLYRIWKQISLFNC